MKTIPNQTQSVIEAVERLGRLAQSLQSWNLVTGLYAEARSSEEDLVHALSWEARSLVIEALKLAFRLGEAGVSGKKQRFACLRVRLDSLSERLGNLGKQCRKALQACPEEEHEVSLKAFAESMSQRGLFRDAGLFCWWLHQNGYLNHQFQPTRCAQELHLFSLRRHAAQSDGGVAKQEATTMLTPIGQQYFHDLFMGAKAGKEAA